MPAIITRRGLRWVACEFGTSMLKQCQYHLVFYFRLQVYNDSNILEKIVKDKQKELGPAPDEDDMGSPKLKLRMFFDLLRLCKIFY